MSLVCNQCGAIISRKEWIDNKGNCDVCAEKEAKKNTLPSKILSWVKRISLYNAIRWTILSPFIAVLWVLSALVIAPIGMALALLICSSWEEYKDVVRQIGIDFITLRFFTDLT